MTRHLAALVVAAALAPAARADLNVSEVAPGLLRGRAPYVPRDFQQLRRLGVRTVLDIRGNQRLASAVERRQAARYGLAYRHVQLGFRPLRDGSAERVVAAMQDTADYPLYVHCNLNRDRTSAVVATYRVRVQGWPAEAAAEEARSFGLRRYFLGLNRYIRALGR